jgi:sugar phosphate isomerase/epimerase
LSLELDVAWVAVAGVDPKTVIARFADRIVAAHIKDIAPKGENRAEDGWADVGHGTLDWVGLMQALRQIRCRYFVIEHDNPSDHRRFARASFASISAF